MNAKILIVALCASQLASGFLVDLLPSLVTQGTSGAANLVQTVVNNTVAVANSLTQIFSNSLQAIFNAAITSLQAKLSSLSQLPSSVLNSISAAASSAIQQLLANVSSGQNFTAAVTTFIQNVTSSLPAANGTATNLTAPNVTELINQVLQNITTTLAAPNATATNIAESIASVFFQAVANLTSQQGSSGISANVSVSVG